jgi:hypothetical protein
VAYRAGGLRLVAAGKHMAIIKAVEHVHASSLLLVRKGSGLQRGEQTIGLPKRGSAPSSSRLVQRTEAVS